MNQIERFCWNHPRFGIPRLMLYIIIGNAIVYLFTMMDSTGTLVSLLAFNPAMFCRGQIWRIVTFVFVPNTYRAIVLLLELYFYYFIGSTLEREWGSGKFTIYYLMGVVLTAVYSLVAYWISGMTVSVTASYLNFSMFFAFATLYPDQRVLLFYFIPIKVKWLGIANAVYFVITMISYLLAGLVVPALLPLVAVLNYLVFCGEWLFDALRPQRAAQRARTIKFKSAAKKIQREQKNAPYTRKCAVCGRTDTDHPELEFRYCSRCQGYHCFCQDHINNHIHFTE